MEVQLYELNQGSKKIGLNIHKGKTKYMTNFKSETIVTENDVIEKVDRYTNTLVKLWWWRIKHEKKLWSG